MAISEVLDKNIFFALLKFALVGGELGNKLASHPPAKGSIPRIPEFF